MTCQVDPVTADNALVYSSLNNATLAAGESEASAAMSASSALAGATAATLAVASKNAAFSSETLASESAATAVSKANVVHNKAIESTIQRELAHKWASEDEAVWVSDGVNVPGFSAYHWARQAQHQNGLTAGTIAQYITDGVADYITYNAIGNSLLNTALGTRIAQIDAIDVRTQADALIMLQEIADRGTAITNEQTLRTTGDDQLAQTINTLSATVVANIAAAVLVESLARATAFDASAMVTSLITAQLNDTVTGLPQTRADLLTESMVTADNFAATSTRIDTLISTYNTAISNASAAIQTEATTRASQNAALASSVTTLQTTVGTNTTALEIAATVVAGINAKYTVKIDTDGYVSGYGLMSTAVDGVPVSSFAIRADTFSIGAPAVPESAGQVAVAASKVYPLVVKTTKETIDGTVFQPGVYIDSAFITKISASQINTRGLTIKDDAGNLILGAGTGIGTSGAGLDYAYVGGATAPSAGATVGANLGTWGLASNTYVLTGNAVTTSNSISKSIATEAWDTHANATTGLVENGLLTFEKTPVATDTSPTLTGTATISSNSYVNNTASTVSVTSSKNFTNNSALTFTKAVSTRSVPLLCQGNVTVSAVNGAGAVTLTKLLAVQSSWDSDVVTTQVNTGAAVVVSFTVATQGFMIGLNTDPKLNYSYTSLDYAFYINGTTWAIFESNASPMGATAFVLTDVFTISYSGTTITYAINGVTKRIVTVAAGLTFYFDSSWYTLGASAANVTYTANGVLDHSFTANPYFDLATRSITHPYATGAWGYAAAYSTQSFVGGCYLIFNASLPGEAMLGFNSDPLVTTSYQGLDYAWHVSGGNSLIYESGTNTLAAEAYTVNTVFEMLYLGNTIYYYKDGVLKRTVVTTAGRTFWLDAAFSNVSTLRNIYFDSVKDKISSSVCLSAGSSLDYGFYFNAGMTTNTVAVMEAGVGVTTLATHLSTDIFTVEYIGTSVIYKVNGVIVRTSTVAAGKVLHLYAESYILAEAVSNIGVFGSAKTPASAIGLSTSTTLASAYTNMPVGVMFNNGFADTYDFIVNGTIIPFGGSYLSSDTFSITYAGTVITVLKNGIAVGTTTVSSALTFYLDTYLYRTSEIFSNITYSYMSTLGANLSGKMSSNSISTYIEDAAIGSAQIGSINLVGNFNVKSATAGARMEMDAQVIKVYDASGILRVQLGNLI